MEESRVREVADVKREPREAERQREEDNEKRYLRK
jgi:hypothetical protein